VASFEKYLHDRIKIGNKTGALNSNNVQIARDRTKLTITAPSDLKFPKRQLKYLSKRYLKKQQLRDYLRVVAASKMTYELRYFSISAADDEEEEE
jgi:large subunit ribosomal protein L22e